MIQSVQRSRSHRSSRQRLPLDVLASRCQKPNYRQIGNWMARRIARPLALRITWLIQPWPISANMVTVVAWSTVLVAAAAFATGSLAGWLAGAIALQAWYVLDHVDGQLARLRDSASLDGVQLDYLMHHWVYLSIPLGVGWGVFASSGHAWWALAGLLWTMGLLLLHLQHDTAYKAFIQRLKRLEGRLWVEGGGGGRPTAQPPLPQTTRGLLKWAARKMCETHVIMNLLLLTALGQWYFDDVELRLGTVLLAISGPVSLIVAIATLVRSQRRHAVEAEFAAWYRTDTAMYLHFENGRWRVVSSESGQTTQPAMQDSLGEQQSP